MDFVSSVIGQLLLRVAEGFAGRALWRGRAPRLARLQLSTPPAAGRAASMSINRGEEFSCDQLRDGQRRRRRIEPGGSASRAEICNARLSGASKSNCTYNNGY
jgi:hypothetical protein